MIIRKVGRQPPPPPPSLFPQRLETLDVLRGFALLGILAMNIRAMAAPMSAYMYPYALFDYEGSSRLAYLFTTVVFDLKMMGLFSMLFGAGVLLYANKRTGIRPAAARALVQADVRPAGNRPPARVLHLGRRHPRALRPLRHPPAVVDAQPHGAHAAHLRRRMLAIGAALAVVHWLAWGSMSEADRAAELELMMPTREQALGHVDLMLGAYTRFVAGSAPGTFMFETMFFLMFFLWRCGGMMLLGMSLYKSGFLDGRLPSSTYARVALIATPVGLGLAFIGALELERVAYAMPIRAAVDLWNYVGAVFASIGYAATLIWIVKRGSDGRLAPPPCCRWADGVVQLPVPQRDRLRVVPRLGLRVGRPLRLRRAAAHRRRDLDRAVDREPDLAPELPVRASRVAVAHADVRARAADASGGTNARTARFLNAAPPPAAPCCRSAMCLPGTSS